MQLNTELHQQSRCSFALHKLRFNFNLNTALSQHRRVSSIVHVFDNVGIIH